MPQEGSFIGRGRSEAADRRWNRGALALPALVLLALLVRVWGLSADLPYLYNADEPGNLAVVDRMVSEGEANPRFFNYPSLFFYLQAFVHLDGPLLFWLPGDQEQAPTAMVLGSWRSSSPIAVLVHRGLSVFLGMLVVVIVWLTTRRLTRGHLAAAVAAALVALSPTLIEQSRYVTPDILAAALVATGCLFAVRLQQSGTLPAHALAGLSVGLAASAKYNAAVVAVAVAAGSVLCARPGRARRMLVGLPIAALVAVVGFLATTPYALLERMAFLEALRFERAHYATGHSGMEGSTLRFYASYLLTHEAILGVLAAVGIVMLLSQRTRQHWRPSAVLVTFPLVYGVAIATLPVRNDQTVMLVLPPLAVLAGLAVESLRRTPAARAHGRAVMTAVAVAALVLAYGAWTTLPARGPTTYEAAQDWLDEHAAPGAAILVESYSPWLDPRRYDVVARALLISEPLPASTEADYVIASEGMYGRFLDDPRRYPEQAAAYRALFASLPEAATFTGAGPTIRIFRSS